MQALAFFVKKVLLFIYLIALKDIVKNK